VRVDGGQVHDSRADDTDGDGVVDDRPHGGRHRRGRGGGHVGVDGRLVHPRHTGDTGGHALDQVVGGDDNAAADVDVDDGRQRGGERQGRGRGRVGRHGARVGANKDAAADVVADDRRGGGRQRHGLGGGHVDCGGGQVHQRRAGDAGGHSLVYGAGANDNAAADVVVDDRPEGGGERHGLVDGNVGVDGGLVPAKQSVGAVGNWHSGTVADGIANDACDGGDANMQCGGVHAANDCEHAHIDHAGTGEDESVERRTVRVGRLGGGLSLLGGVSVSCRGDPLSSLDAEDISFLAGALSSSCSPEGLPSRFDLSCPHTSDGEQLGAVVAVASAQNCGTSGVGGGSEVPAHGLGS